MKVRFYGVRGSIATSGPETVRYGGNTSCVLVEAGDQKLIFDAGTGIQRLGTELGPTDVDAHLFLSHLHWDHIQGFPFFTPAFVPGNQLSVYRVALSDSDVGIRQALADQMQPPNFPVPLDIMGADLRFWDVPEHDRIRLPHVEVIPLAVDHPNGCVAYRVQRGQKAVVYATDLEHHEGEINGGLVELCRGADVLIYDAMYTPEEYAGEVGMSRKGWGHSTFDAGAAIAEKAGVKTLCLFHHDPGHDDVFLDGLGDRARRRFADTVVAREGLTLSL